MKKFNKVITTVIGVSMVAAMFAGCSIGSAKTEELEKTTIDSFSSIHLDVDVAEIDIITTTDEFAIEYEIHGQNVDYSVEDDVLTVNAEGIRNIGINNNDRSYLKIYVPEGSEFVSLDYEGEVGDINIENLAFDDVNITTDVANVTLTDVTVNNSLNIETDVGNIDVTLANSDCSYEVSADIANISINGSEFDGMDVTKTYTSEAGPQVNIETDCGEINLEF